MFRLVLAWALASVVAVPQAPPPGDDATRLVVSDLQTTRRIETKSVPGVPSRFCPSPDGTEIYLRMSQVDRWGNESLRHYLITLCGGGTLPLDGEPLWAGPYWMWKSAPASPHRADFRITVESREEMVRTTNVPREGNVGQNTGDPTAGLDEVAKKAAFSSQKIAYQTFRLRGQVVGLGVNAPVLPGRTFGWAPSPRALIAYTNEKGRLTLMDDRGRTRQVGGTKDVLLPAWTNDGRAVIFLQKAGRKGYDVRTVAVR